MIIEQFEIAGKCYQADITKREEPGFKDRPVCLFEFETDFNSNCHFLNNFESVGAARDFLKSRVNDLRALSAWKKQQNL